MMAARSIASIYSRRKKRRAHLQITIAARMFCTTTWWTTLNGWKENRNEASMVQVLQLGYDTLAV